MSQVAFFTLKLMMELTGAMNEHKQRNGGFVEVQYAVSSLRIPLFLGAVLSWLYLTCLTQLQHCKGCAESDGGNESCRNCSFLVERQTKGCIDRVHTAH